MTIDAWLQAAVADAERRGLPELKPILEALARATTALRAADFNDNAAAQSPAGGQQAMMTIEQFGRRLRARELTAVRVTEECLRRIEADNPAPERVHPGDGRQRAAPGRAKPTRSSPPATTADRCTACRSRSRTCWISAACRPPRRHACARGTSRSATPRRSRTCARPARSSSEKRTCTSSRSARRARTRRSARCATRTTRHDRPADRAADRPRASPPGWRSPPSAPIPAAPSAFRPPPAASSGLKPSFGEVSMDGVVPLSRTLDHVGPLAANVADASIVYHALLGDARTTPPVPMPMHGLRLAVPRKYFCDLLDDEVRARFEGALDRLRTAGAHVDDIEIRHAAEIGGRLPAYRAGRCGGLSCRHARDDARALHRRRCACGSKWAAT